MVRALTFLIIIFLGIGGYLLSRDQVSLPPSDAQIQSWVFENPAGIDLPKLYQQSPDLLDPLNMYPRTDLYSQKDLKDILTWMENCKGSVHSSSHPAVNKALILEQYRCRKEKPPIKLLTSPPWIHPWGGSFAKRMGVGGPMHILELSTETASKTDDIFLPFIAISSRNWLKLFKESLLIFNHGYIIARHPTEVFKIRGFAADKLKVIAPGFTLTEWPQCSFRSKELCWNRDLFYGYRTLGVTATLVGIILTAFLLIFVGRRERRRFFDQRLVLRIMAHELRTPITTLRLDWQNIKDSSKLTDQTERRINRNLEDLQSLSEISEELIRARDRSGRYGMTLSLKNWIPDLLSKYGDVKILDGSPDVSLFSHPLLLRILMENLVKNARIHGVGPVEVWWEDDETEISIKIKDHGVFSKDAKTKAPNGLGFGLGIVRDLARILKCQVSLEQRSPTQWSIVFRKFR